MRIYDLLNDDEFKEMHDRDMISSYNERCYRGPRHVVLPAMTLYHKKSRLLQKDIDDILEWYGNRIAMGFDEDSSKNAKPLKWENKYGWMVSPEEIAKRDELIDKEIEFRNKVVDEYYKNTFFY